MDPITLLMIAGTLGSLYMGWRQSRKNKQFQEQQNEQDRSFQREMYGRQRQDAMLDADRMNAYNSPVEQMNRLRQAGLNPQLVYGKGAESTAAVIRGAQPSGGSLPAPKHELPIQQLSGIANGFMNLKQQQAQTDLLEEQKRSMAANQVLTQAQTAKTLQETARSKFDLEQVQTLKDLTIEKAQLDNNTMKQNLQLALNQDERARLQSADMHSNAVQDLVLKKLDGLKKELDYSQQKEIFGLTKEQLQVAIENARKEGRIKELQAQLAEQGITPNDPLWLRAVVGILANKFGVNVGDILKPGQTKFSKDGVDSGW